MEERPNQFSQTLRIAYERACAAGAQLFWPCPHCDDLWPIVEDERGDLRSVCPLCETTSVWQKPQLG